MQLLLLRAIEPFVSSNDFEWSTERSYTSKCVAPRHFRAFSMIA